MEPLFWPLPVFPCPMQSWLHWFYRKQHYHLFPLLPQYPIDTVAPCVHQVVPIDVHYYLPPLLYREEELHLLPGDPFLDPQYHLPWWPWSLLSWGGDNWSECGLLVHIHSMWYSCYYLPFWAVAAEVSVNSSVLLSYLSPEQSFVQVLVHCMCASAACNALCSLSLWWSSTGPSGVEFYVQQALCCSLLCACSWHIASRDYSGMLLQSYKQFHITDQ